MANMATSAHRGEPSSRFSTASGARSASQWIGVSALLFLLTSCGGAAPTRLVSRAADASRSLLIRNVRVFDARNAVLQEEASDVTVRDGRIEAIEPTRARGASSEFQVIDGKGGSLLPGLVDVHTHTGSTAAPPWVVSGLPDLEGNLAAYLYAGTTTVLDLGSLTPAVFDTRRSIADGELLGPHFYAAGPVFTAPDGHPAEVLRAWLPWYLSWYVVPRATREVATPGEAREAVGELLADRPDILKITIDAEATNIPRLAPETIAAITSTGHAQGVRSIAHIGSSAEALDAVRSGVDALAHAPWRDELTDETVRAIADAQVPVVVTLAVFDLSSQPRGSADAFLPIEREIAGTELVEALLTERAEPDEYTTAYLAAANAAHDARRRNVAKLRAAGVAVLAGSDACNYNDIPGAGLHVELAKLVEAGMTPGEALRAATWENARFLAKGDADFGEIAVGKRADLLLVAGDPTASIAELQNIEHVVLDGVPLVRRPPRIQAREEES